MWAPLLEQGVAEGLKCSVHAILLACVLLCALYNGAAWVVRPAAHLAINTLVYLAIIPFEVRSVLQHWEHWT